MTAAIPENSGASGTADPAARHADAFRVADELAVHGSTCVCPRCAGRLPFLLRDLAHAMDADTPGA